MARCSNGHEAIPGTAGSKFCTTCGAPMMVTCPNGHEVKAAAHCTVCGVPLPTATTAAAKESAADDAERPVFSDTDTTSSATTPPPNASDEHSSRRSWLIIGSVALLVMLIGGGAYFGVTRLTDSSGTKLPPQATQPSTTAQPSPVAPSTITTPAPATAPTSPTTVPSQTTTAQPAPSTSPASAVVEEYFADINAGDYADAWSLGGRNLQGGSYDSFVQGFATTAFDSVTIVSTTGDTVQMRLDALQTDGSHRYFAGTYTVRDGVIASADVRQTSG